MTTLKQILSLKNEHIDLRDNDFNNDFLGLQPISKEEMKIGIPFFINNSYGFTTKISQCNGQGFIMTKLLYQWSLSHNDSNATTMYEIIFGEEDIIYMKLYPNVGDFVNKPKIFVMSIKNFNKV